MESMILARQSVSGHWRVGFYRFADKEARLAFLKGKRLEDLPKESFRRTPIWSPDGEVRDINQISVSSAREAIELAKRARTNPRSNIRVNWSVDPSVPIYVVDETDAVPSPH